MELQQNNPKVLLINVDQLDLPALRSLLGNVDIHVATILPPVDIALVVLRVPTAWEQEAKAVLAQIEEIKKIYQTKYLVLTNFSSVRLRRAIPAEDYLTWPNDMALLASKIQLLLPHSIVQNPASLPPIAPTPSPIPFVTPAVQPQEAASTSPRRTERLVPDDENGGDQGTEGQPQEVQSTQMSWDLTEADLAPDITHPDITQMKTTVIKAMPKAQPEAMPKAQQADQHLVQAEAELTDLLADQGPIPIEKFFEVLTSSLNKIAAQVTAARQCLNGNGATSGDEDNSWTL